MDLSRVELDIDPTEIELVAIGDLDTTTAEDESEQFRVANDANTFFIVQNDSETDHLEITAINARARIRTPHGYLETEPAVIDIGEGDDSYYAFRLPPEIFNDVEGFVTFTQVATFGNIWCARFPREYAYRGPVIAVDGEDDVRVAVGVDAVAVPLGEIDPTGGITMRKGSMSVYIVENPEVGDIKLSLQTTSVGESGRDFGERFGFMEAADADFPAYDFCVHPVTLPAGALVAFVRPLGAYEGHTGDDYGAVGLLVEDDTTLNFSRLDLAV